jgi:hypothetical protein
MGLLNFSILNTLLKISFSMVKTRKAIPVTGRGGPLGILNFCCVKTADL